MTISLLKIFEIKIKEFHVEAFICQIVPDTNLKFLLKVNKNQIKIIYQRGPNIVHFKPNLKHSNPNPK